jgi:hypothetical protein
MNVRIFEDCPRGTETTLNSGLFSEHFFSVSEAYWKATSVTGPFSYINTAICSNCIIRVFLDSGSEYLLK